MRTLKGTAYKWRTLLDAIPGEQIAIACANERDANSKSVSCRVAIKRQPEAFKKIGVKDLKVARTGNTVLVTLVPDEGDEARFNE